MSDHHPRNRDHIEAAERLEPIGRRLRVLSIARDSVHMALPDTDTAVTVPFVASTETVAETFVPPAVLTQSVEMVVPGHDLDPEEMLRNVNNIHRLQEDAQENSQ